MEEKRTVHLEKTWKGFSYNVFGVILPFVLSLIPIMILKKYEAIFAFLDQGQILLFGAGLYTSSLFLFGENQGSIKRNYDKVLSNLSLWCLIISSSFYAIIYCLDLLKGQVFTFNIWFVRVASILLFLVSVVSCFRSVFIDFLKIYPDVDVRGESSRAVEHIMEQL